jgi:death on curing protein
MITVEMAERAHALLVAEFGGATGLRDLGDLEAALARPHQTFGGQDLILTAEGKAAAMLESIIIRHPWMDGNKRTGYVLMELVLLDAGIELVATEDDKYAMTIRVSEGRSSAKEVQAWIEARVKKV